MQSKTKNHQGHDAIERMLAGALPGQALASGALAVQEFPDGWFNASYALRLADGRELVLKIAPPEGVVCMRYEHNIMETEVAVMRLLQGHPRIPVPAVLAHERSRRFCDADYFLMERVPGDNLESLLATLPPPEQAALERETGRVIRAVNDFSGEYFGLPGNPTLRASSWREAFGQMFEAVLEDASEQRADCGHRHAELRAALHRQAGALDEVERPQLLHWDGWNKNFLVHEGRISGLIDFERALWGDPLMEAQFRPVLDSRITEAMRAHGKTEFSAAERRRCALYSLYLALIMNTEGHYRDYENDEVERWSRHGLDASMAALREGAFA